MVPAFTLGWEPTMEQMEVLERQLVVDLEKAGVRQLGAEQNKVWAMYWAMEQLWEREKIREMEREIRREWEREWGWKLESEWERDLWFRIMKMEWKKEWERILKREWEKEWERKLRREWDLWFRIMEMWLNLRLFLESILLAILSPASMRVPVWRRRLKSASVCMPWAIPPALLVLWSVVWMFRPTPDGNTSWYWQEQPAAISPPVPSEPALADTEIAPTFPWRVDTSIQNYEPVEQPWPFFDPLDLGAVSAQVDDGYSANSVYLGGYGRDLLAASSPDFSTALSTIPDLVPNSNFLVGWPSLSNDALVSSSSNFTGGALRGSSEPHATQLLPAAQDLQTHAGIWANVKVDKLDGRRKYTRRSDTKVPCTQCSKRFDSQKDVNRHIEAVHEGRKDYICDVRGCGYKAGRKDNLQRHKRSHGSRNDLACGTSTSSSASPMGLGTPTTTHSGAKKRRHDEIMGVGGLSHEKLVMGPRNERLTREELEQRVQEMENQLRGERLRRVGAEDRLKTREGLEDKVKDMEIELREERFMRIELEDKVKGVQNEMRELKENVSTLQLRLAQT